MGSCFKYAEITKFKTVLLNKGATIIIGIPKINHSKRKYLMTPNFEVPLKNK